MVYSSGCDLLISHTGEGAENTFRVSLWHQSSWSFHVVLITATSSVLTIEFNQAHVGVTPVSCAITAELASAKLDDLLCIIHHNMPRATRHSTTKTYVPTQSSYSTINDDCTPFQVLGGEHGRMLPGNQHPDVSCVYLRMHIEY